MSLQVWLPLTGHLRNQGLQSGSATGGTVDNNGKLGQCYSVSSAHPISYSYTVPTTDTFSIAYWQYMPSTQSSNTDWEVLLQFAGKDGTADATMTISWASYQNMKIFDNNNNQKWWLTANQIGGYGKWAHIALVNKGTNLSVYVNGALLYSATASVSIRSGALTLGVGVNSTWGEFKYNDVRIYDHALSPKEVEEIAKGMVAHYKLDDGYTQQTVNYSSQTNKGGWNNSGAATRTTNDSKYANAPYPDNVYSIKVTTAGNCAHTFGNTIYNMPSQQLTASVWCYLSGPQDSSSVYVRSTKTDGSVGDLKYKGDANPTHWPLEKWIRLTLTFTSAADATTFYFCTYLNPLNSERAFCGWQIERNANATPFTKTSRLYKSTYTANNLVTSDVISIIYNNYGVTASITALSEKFMGATVYRLTMTPTSGSLSSFKGDLASHGVYGWGRSFSANTKYCFWIYYRPVTHTDIRVGGTASNISGWTEIAPKYYMNGWYRVGQYRNGSVTTDKSDNIFTSFYTPTAATGVPITIDFCAPHLISGSQDIIETYPFDTGLTDINYAYDVSGYTHDAIINGPWTTSISACPRYQTALHFNDLCEVNTGWEPINQDEFTSSCWFKLDNLSNRPTLYSNYAGDNSNPFIEVELNSNIRVHFSDENNHTMNWYPVTVSANIWYFMVLTYKNHVFTLYLYDETNKWRSWSYTDSTFSRVSSLANRHVLLGKMYGNPYYVNGYISDMRFYATALTEAQAKDLCYTSMIVDSSGNVTARTVVS